MSERKRLETKKKTSIVVMTIAMEPGMCLGKRQCRSKSERLVKLHSKMAVHSSDYG